MVSGLEGGTVLAHAVLVGRPALLAEQGVEVPAEPTTTREAAEAAGRTAVVVAWDGVARAVLAVSDTVRPAPSP